MSVSWGRIVNVSVCIAAYQGERFIFAQLQSICATVPEKDEIIVVDDHSCDATCQRVQALADSRIRLVQHQYNRGVAASFEEAISLASGQIIFLSDQDDLWMTEKVRRILEVLLTHPEITLITSDAI